MLIYENRPSKMKFFDVMELFFMNLDLKNRCKNEFKDKTLKPYGQVDSVGGKSLKSPTSN